MHMAAAAGIPTLGLFGPTPHEVYQPWGAKAAYMVAPEGDLAKLSPADVAQKLSTLIRR
jgi:lipopolysaccharide export system permease protein